MTEQKTKEELIEQQEQLKSEIERLQKIIDASSETTFEIIIEDLKQQMIENVQEEHWSNVKSCIKEVDSVNGTKNFITKQSELLNRKREELEEVKTQIDNYQPTLFEQSENEESKIAPTNIISPDKRPIRTGDVFMSTDKCRADGEQIYYAVIESCVKNKFIIISNSYKDDDKLLHLNLDILKDTEYVGNAYVETDNVNTITNAKWALNKIEEYISIEDEEGEDEEG